jgi:hypothetical protein
LGAAVLALGRPNLALGVAFLAGDLPTAAEALAAAQLLVWAIVLGGAAWSLLAIRPAISHAVSRNRLREGSVLVTGLLILAAGAAHHFAYDPGMSGGSAREAQSVLAR